MPRSTLLRALGAGALCLTASATTPALADAAPQVGVSAKQLNIHAGSRATVKGRLAAPGTARLQIQRGNRWVTIDRDRTDAAGRYALRGRLKRPTSARARVKTSTGATRVVGRLNVYRRALASWYGPGLFGNKLGCGGTLTTGSIGVANKHLPCGSKVTLRHRGRVLRVRVIDRGPYVGGREYDLTAATARKLGFSGHGPIQATR
ncbi:septal ring lytic transglycosylase RlpA family protein [Solirubrobacter phytolaccae]|uniref:Septal ring lytic transglycosylase RlpA family protein n=1 Tax=Solirubrobacter phytolaccae TaxID=1404360 RepID=A0A9X3N9H5_9ACTN|nr:septal ring lytic transglycosylase RlpA family protein [Solirubrobacter phytolaccae]MDA0180742.1 septal ring lytic transglycosylase RlpA family protein [Solirubrobacter phytolaccae]